MPCRVFFYSETPLKFPFALAWGIWGEAGREDVREGTTERNGQCVISKMEKLKSFFWYLFGSGVNNYNF